MKDNNEECRRIAVINKNHISNQVIEYNKKENPKNKKKLKNQ